MRLLSGLHAVWLRRTRWKLIPNPMKGARPRPGREHGKYVAYIAWRPGSEADAMWWEHSAAVFREQWRERLTRSG